MKRSSSIYNADNPPLISRSSMFFSKEASSLRCRVIKEGYLSVENKNQKKDGQVKFNDYYCTLTNDGRLTMIHEDEETLTVIVEQCIVISGSNVFRMILRDEKNLQSSGTYEKLFRCDNDSEGADWLIMIELALRNRLKHFRDKLDCARGQLSVLEVPNNNMKLKTILSQLKEAGVYHCFYYNETLRVRGIDGRMTSSFLVDDFYVDPNMPLCFKIFTPGRTFWCQCDDLQQHKRWINAMKRTHRKKQEMCYQRDNVGNDTITCNILVGPNPTKLIRVSAKYDWSTKILETKDFTGVVDKFYIDRYFFMPPSFAGTYNFKFMGRLPGKEFINAQQVVTLFVSCHVDDVKKWLDVFQRYTPLIFQLIDKVILQIELRRIMKSETANEQNSTDQPVLCAHAYHLLLLDQDKLDKALKSNVKWPVERLENLFTLLLKLFPQPLIPYVNQPQFVQLGQKIMNSTTGYNAFIKPVMECVGMIPDQSHELLEKITIHISRMIMHQGVQNVQKAPHERRERNSSLRYSLAILYRVAKYLFRFNEQGLKTETCDERLKAVSQVLLSFQIRFMQQMQNQN